MGFCFVLLVFDLFDRILSFLCTRLTEVEIEICVVTDILLNLLKHCRFFGCVYVFVYNDDFRLSRYSPLNPYYRLCGNRDAAIDTKVSEFAGLILLLISTRPSFVWIK